jgi:hypothetical protein
MTSNMTSTNMSGHCRWLQISAHVRLPGVHIYRVINTTHHHALTGAVERGGIQNRDTYTYMASTQMSAPNTAVGRGGPYQYGNSRRSRWHNYNRPGGRHYYYRRDSSAPNNTVSNTNSRQHFCAPGASSVPKNGIQITISSFVYCRNYL